MTLSQQTNEEFERIFSDTERPIYNSALFCELNKGKADELIYFVSKSNSKAIGIIFGKSGNTLKSPFSAPFGGFIFKGKIGLDNITKTMSEIKEYAKKNNLNIEITLPPLFYSPSLISMTVCATLNVGMSLQYCDVNHHYNLISDKDFYTRLTPSARNKYNLARKREWSFKHGYIADAEFAKQAYNIIKTNREEQGYPLKMSFDDIKATSAVVNMDFFILYNEDNTPVAASIVYRLSSKIAQIIYWGDIESFRPNHPMNIFPMYIFEYYTERGFETVDIGPSSSEGQPNYGLTAFKEGLGCETSLKAKSVYINE